MNLFGEPDPPASVSPMERSDMPCKHSRATGSIYQWCPDCLAVRRAPAPGKVPDKWHVCELCSPSREGDSPHRHSHLTSPTPPHQNP